jgi:hypothetical protein
MADHRDKYQHKIPPASVRAQTAKPDDVAARIAHHQAEIDRLGGGIPEREIPDLEARTPVNADPIARLEFRQRRTSVQIDNVALKVASLDVGLTKVDARLENLDEKVDQFLKGEIDHRIAREERADTARAQAETARIELERARATAELEEKKAVADLRKSTAMYRAKIILQIVLTVGGLLATYLAGRAGA